MSEGLDYAKGLEKRLEIRQVPEDSAAESRGSIGEELTAQRQLGPCRELLDDNM